MTFSKAFFLAVFVSGGLFWAACDAPPEAGGTAGQTATHAGAGAADTAGADEVTGPAEWMTNYEEALALASEQDKPVLINFTGSDWCPPCMQLKKEVFNDPEFERYARENLVLVELDYPRGLEQPREVVEQNRKLQQEYAIEGFPTLIVLSPDGKEQKRHVGYRPGGPEAFVGWVES